MEPVVTPQTEAKAVTSSVTVAWSIIVIHPTDVPATRTLTLTPFHDLWGLTLLSIVGVGLILWLVLIFIEINS